MMDRVYRAGSIHIWIRDITRAPSWEKEVEIQDRTQEYGDLKLRRVEDLRALRDAIDLTLAGEASPVDGPYRCPYCEEVCTICAAAR